MYVSIDFDRLYPGGAGFPELGSPDTIDLPALDPAAFGIERVGDLFPAHGYGAPFDPSIFVEDTDATRHMWPLYQHHAVQSAPPSILVTIADATVFASVVYCGTGESRRIVYETQRPNDRDATTLPTSHALAHAMLPTGLDAGRDQLFIGSAGSFNYGHFLVDDLPRIAAVALMRKRRPDRSVTIVMTSYGPKMDGVRGDAIAALCDGDVRTLFLDPSRPYRIPGLHYASPISYHPIRKHVPALDFLVAAAARAIPGEGGGSRVFIERGTGGAGRLLVNEAQLVGQLRQSGFKIIRPDRMTFVEQVLALRNARTVIGQMGAAMTNTIFAPDDATLVYLAPAGWLEPFYWDLANARRQRYRVLYGRSLTTNRPAHEADFLINPATFSALPEVAALAVA